MGPYAPKTVPSGGVDITLTLSADGEKLTKISPAETRNYIAGIEYLGANLDAIYHAEGRCTPNGTTAFHYEYTLKDHLGNARVNFRANGTAVTFLEEMHYYPFGMLMEGIGTAAVTVNKYKYNGKELNDDLGLNWYDYGARWYDAAVGRRWSVDPLAEATANASTYTYVLNNPMIFIDPTGMLAVGRGQDPDAYRLMKEDDENKRAAQSTLQHVAKVAKEFLAWEGEKTGNNDGKDENQDSNRYKEIVEELKKERTNIDANLATYDDERTYSSWDGSPIYGSTGEEKLLTDMIDFANAVKNQGATGTIRLWIEPNLYMNDRDANPKDIPIALTNAMNSSRLNVKVGMVNTYNRLIKAFNSKGISFDGTNRKLEIWIMPSRYVWELKKLEKNTGLAACCYKNIVLWKAAQP